MGSAVGSETDGRVPSLEDPQAPTSSAIDPTNASTVSVRFMTPPSSAETAMVPQAAATPGQAAPVGR